MSVVFSLQAGVTTESEERSVQVTSAIPSEPVAHTLVTPHTTGVLVTPSMPSETVGVPINPDVLQGYRTVPQQAINASALHQFSAFPHEMPEGTTVSFIPQPGMAVGDSGHVDPDQVALGTAYMTAQLGPMRGEADQTGLEHGYQQHVTIPLTATAPMCMPTPMGLAQGGTSAMPTHIHPGEHISLGVCE